MNQQQNSRKLMIILGAIAIMLIALPRFLPELELSRRNLLWYPTLHQFVLYLVLGCMLWLVTGCRRSIAITCTIFITLRLGPNLAGTTEYSLTGNNETVFAISEQLGVNRILNTVYPLLYDTLGYSIKVSA